MTILDEIADRTRQRVRKCKEHRPFKQVKREAAAVAADTGYPFEKAMLQDGLSFICEVKKASPSKGIIAEDFPYVEIAKDYERGGASAVSVLTEPYYFQGSDAYFREIRQAVALPMLRKDFVVDEYMIYEAKAMGADAVLLICAILDDEQLAAYYRLADGLGMTALVETHDLDEINRALTIGARVIGVNNRDLRDFSVDLEHSIRYRSQVPKDVIFLSESGIRTKEDLSRLAENQVDGVLVGESLMRAENREQAVRDFILAGRHAGG